MSGPTSPGTPLASLKSAAAFRTIGEVADELGLPQHVLRFWETRFPQIQPMKRGGNRRYYRPADVALLRRIHNMLHAEGYTIKGVQKLLLDGVKPAATAPAAPESVTGLDLGAIRAIRNRLAAGLVAARA